MDYRPGQPMKDAEAWTKKTHDLSLKHYLRAETERGRSDKAIATDFSVHCHTICNWKRLLGLVTVRRVINRQTH